MIKTQTYKPAYEISIILDGENTEEVTISDRQSELAAHFVDVPFTIAGGGVLFRILGVLDHVVYLVKHGPTDIERGSRLLVANYLAKVVEINQDYEDFRIDRQFLQEFSQNNAAKNDVLSRAGVFEQNHPIPRYGAPEKSSRTH
ncbi:MAG TPA: hypothetical protein VFR51_08730 [Pyrinomonadaceae bacterium]|nr:hypothetical protein [Pyrinomonadaceae bacterium]